MLMTINFGILRVVARHGKAPTGSSQSGTFQLFGSYNFSHQPSKFMTQNDMLMTKDRSAIKFRNDH